MHKQPLLQGFLHVNWLGPGWVSRHTKRHLCHQGPVGRYVPCGLDLLINQRVVVLQASAEPFVGESGPDDELVDGRRVLFPHGEVVLGKGELLLELACVLWILEEQDGAVGVAEAFETRLGVGVELLWRGDGFDDFSDGVPVLEVLVLEEEDKAGGIGAKC